MAFSVQLVAFIIVWVWRPYIFIKNIVLLQSSYGCSSATFLQCVTHPIKWNKCQSFVFILLKERKRLGDESNQALCFSPGKRWNLLLLIISLLQHSVSACNISPALLGWNHCLPTALSSATINSSAPVLAPPGLSWESRASLCLLWAALGAGGGQNPYRNSQSLSQHQHRTSVCWFWYTTGTLAWFVKWEMHHHKAAWGREGDCVYISMELNTKLHLHCLPSSSVPQTTLESRMGPRTPVSGLFWR